MYVFERCIDESLNYGFTATSYQTGELTIFVGGWNDKGQLRYHVEYIKKGDNFYIIEGQKSQDDLWKIRFQTQVGSYMDESPQFSQLALENVIG